MLPVPAAVAEEDRDLADLQELGRLVVADRGVKRKPRQSPETAEHARNQRALQTERAKKLEAEARADRAEALLRHVGSHFPVVGRILSLPPRRAPFDVVRAALQERLAFLPTAREDVARKAQARAASLVAMCGLQLQREAVDRCWAARPGTDEPSDPVGKGMEHRFRVNALSWQWDETTQKLRAAISARLLPGEKVSGGSVSKQVMMQSGLFTNFTKDRLQET